MADKSKTQSKTQSNAFKQLGGLLSLAFGKLMVAGLDRVLPNSVSDYMFHPESTKLRKWLVQDKGIPQIYVDSLLKTPGYHYLFRTKKGQAALANIAFGGKPTDIFADLKIISLSPAAKHLIKNYNRLTYAFMGDRSAIRQIAQSPNAKIIAKNAKAFNNIMVNLNASDRKQLLNTLCTSPNAEAVLKAANTQLHFTRGDSIKSIRATVSLNSVLKHLTAPEKLAAIDTLLSSTAAELKQILTNDNMRSLATALKNAPEGDRAQLVQDFVTAVKTTPAQTSQQAPAATKVTQATTTVNAPAPQAASPQKTPAVSPQPSPANNAPATPVRTAAAPATATAVNSKEVITDITQLPKEVAVQKDIPKTVSTAPADKMTEKLPAAIKPEIKATTQKRADATLVADAVAHEEPNADLDEPSISYSTNSSSLGAESYTASESSNTYWQDLTGTNPQKKNNRTEVNSRTGNIEDVIPKEPAGRQNNLDGVLSKSRSTLTEWVEEKVAASKAAAKNDPFLPG